MPGLHTELKLVRGILNAPGDTNSGEQGYTVIDLLTGAAEGLALSADTDGWNPTLPAPKAGLWSEVPFGDGRTPIASAEANVIETLRLTVTASTHLRLSQLLRELYALIEDCDRYWNDEFYNQPVFIHWWATGAPGRQYALIMSIDVDTTIPTTEDENVVTRDVVLTIEREPFWRAEVPPGANPIYWTLFAQGKQPGLHYDYLADLRLLADASLPLLYWLAKDTLENKVDYTTLTSAVNTINAQNALFIPAEDIPGDAPALVQLTLRNTLSVNTLNRTFMIARSTREVLQTNRDASIARFVTMIPFTAGNIIGAPVTAADTGGIGGYNVSTATTIALSRLEITGGAAATVWQASVGLSKNIQRGRFAIFARCRQNAGSSGDYSLQLVFSYGASNGFSVTTRAVTPIVQAGVGATTSWPLLYIDTIRLPLDRDATLSMSGPNGGAGLYNDFLDSLTISLNVTRTAGVALLYFIDLILMPYDEALLDTVMVSPVPLYDMVNAVVVDNTGYLTRGKPYQQAVSMNTIVNPGFNHDYLQPAVEQRGSPLTLMPGVDNAIYILEKTDTNLSQPYQVIEASVNIVPRWRGIRGV